MFDLAGILKIRSRPNARAGALCAAGSSAGYSSRPVLCLAAAFVFAPAFPTAGVHSEFLFIQDSHVQDKCADPPDTCDCWIKLWREDSSKISKDKQAHVIQCLRQAPTQGGAPGSAPLPPIKGSEKAPASIPHW